MGYPYLRHRERGAGAGRIEIVFSEEHGWDEAQVFAAQMIQQLGLSVDRRVDGPDAWLWMVHGEGGEFVFGYDDFPCETTMWAANATSDIVLEQLFHKRIVTPGSPAHHEG